MGTICEDRTADDDKQLAQQPATVHTQGQELVVELSDSEVDVSALELKTAEVDTGVAQPSNNLGSSAGPSLKLEGVGPAANRSSDAGDPAGPASKQKGQEQKRLKTGRVTGAPAQYQAAPIRYAVSDH